MLDALIAKIRGIIDHRLTLPLLLVSAVGLFMFSTNVSMQKWQKSQEAALGTKIESAVQSYGFTTPGAQTYLAVTDPTNSNTSATTSAFTGHLIPRVDAHYDIGSGASTTNRFRFRDGWFSGNLYVGGAISVSSCTGCTASLPFTQNVTITPNNTYDLGSSTSSFRDVYASGTAYIAAFVGTGATTSTLAGGLRINAGGLRVSTLVSCDTIDTDSDGDFVCGSDSSGSAGFGGHSAFNIFPTTNNTFDLGFATSSWRHVYASGTVFAGALDAGVLNSSSNSLLQININGAPSYSLADTYFRSFNNNATDLGTYDAAWMGLYVSSTAFLTTVNNSGTITSNALSVTGAASSTFTPGISALGFSGGYLTLTSSNTSTIVGKLSTAGLSSSAGFTLTGGSILNTSAATSSFTGGITASGLSASSLTLTGNTTSTMVGNLSVTGLTASTFSVTGSSSSTIASGLFISNGGLRVAGLISCDTVDTDNTGKLVCGTDGGGAGASFGGDAAFNIYPTTNNTRDLGFPTSSWRAIYASSTAFLSGIVTNGSIIPIPGGSFDDLGAPTSSWRSIYTSSTLFLGGNLSIGGDILPKLTNSINLGSPTGSLKDVYASGTAYLNSMNIAQASTITLQENAKIALDPAGSTDGKYTGITISGTAGATLAFGDIVYLAVADSRWELADADAASTAGDVQIGMVVLAAGSDGDPTTILLYGTIRADVAFPALTVGAPVYVGTTAGDIQVAQPSGTDDVIRRAGFAITADEIIFNPSNDYITHT